MKKQKSYLETKYKEIIEISEKYINTFEAFKTKHNIKCIGINDAESILFNEYKIKALESLNILQKEEYKNEPEIKADIDLEIEEKFYKKSIIIEINEIKDLLAECLKDIKEAGRHTALANSSSGALNFAGIPQSEDALLKLNEKELRKANKYKADTEEIEKLFKIVKILQGSEFDRMRETSWRSSKSFTRQWQLLCQFSKADDDDFLIKYLNTYFAKDRNV